jgi:hypothetical protein
LGVVQSTHSLGMVSLWYENGTIHDYVKRNPESNRLKLVNMIIAYSSPVGLIEASLFKWHPELPISTIPSLPLFTGT